MSIPAPLSSLLVDHARRPQLQVIIIIIIITIIIIIFLFFFFFIFILSAVLSHFNCVSSGKLSAGTLQPAASHSNEPFNGQ